MKCAKLRVFYFCVFMAVTVIALAETVIALAETAIVLAETVTILKNWAEMVGRIGLAEMTCILWEVKYFFTNKYMRQTAAIG